MDCAQQLGLPRASVRGRNSEAAAPLEGSPAHVELNFVNLENNIVAGLLGVPP